MVFHEADDHESDEPRTSPPGRILPFASRKQPDWLTGPDDDLGGALDGMKAGAPAEALPSPVLLRPAARASDRGAVPESDYIAPGKPAADSGPAPVHPAGAWAPAASSVPSLKLVLPMEPGRDEEEPVPGRPARIVGLPGHQEDHPYGASAPPPALKPLEEPWWVIALDTLRTSLPVQVAVAGALVGCVLLAYWMWPRGVGTTPISEVRRHPALYDGRTVVVRGRAGDDVFAVGGGWAFFLMQGRDTIVAFCRTGAPKPRDVVTLRGQVSTGFLDGSARQALFEDTARAR